MATRIIGIINMDTASKVTVNIFGTAMVMVSPKLTETNPEITAENPIRTIRKGRCIIPTEHEIFKPSALALV